MTRQNLILLAGGGSAALLLGALGFQFIGGLFPCELCLWQRWPHLAACVLALLALKIRGATLALLGALAAFASAAIGGFHVGVEYGWWQGLESCTGAGLSGLSMDTLLDPTAAAPGVVRCDQIAWSLLGISMAGWNMLLSLGLGLVWLKAASTRD